MFPLWLKNKITEEIFDSRQYKSAHLIQFILNFVDNALGENIELSKLCKDIIICTIKNQGDSFRLSTDIQYEIKIKDRINLAFEANGENETKFDDYKIQFDGLWNSLQNPNDKLKLIFLVAQLAKRGALGYELDNRNTANIAFYRLTAYLLDKMILMTPDAEPLLNPMNAGVKIMRDALENGLCIEAESYKLIIEHGHIHLNEVWQEI